VTTTAARLPRPLAALLAMCTVPLGPAAAEPRRPASDPPEHPFLSYEHPQDWTLRATVSVRAWEDNLATPVRIDSWAFETAAILFPLVEQTASSNLDVSSAAGTLDFNDYDVANEFTLIGGYHSGQKYARFDAVDVAAREMGLEVRFLARSWRTVLNEEAARAVAWPEGDWPDEAASTLDPQPFVELPFGNGGNVAELDRLALRWTDGADPKSVPPLTLAKWFAAKAIDHVQINGDGIERGPNGIEFEGFQLQGAPMTARRGRGSAFDAAAFLAAMYRRAGLPARIVIAYREVGDNDDAQDRDDRGARRLRAYVEFYLYDEPNTRGGWIPVDIVELRRRSSRAPSIDRPWDFFGTHDELDLFVPIAFNFHPPTTVRAYGAPALWGWFVTPTPPATAWQYLDFSVSRTTVTSGGPLLPAER